MPPTSPSPPSSRLQGSTQHSSSGSAQSPKHVPTMTRDNGDTASPQAEASSSSKASAPRIPPETPEAIQTRFRVIAAFWAVIIFLGFPIWWKTTSIYRAHLPIQEMVDWADGKVGGPHEWRRPMAPVNGQATHPRSTRHVARSSPSRSMLRRLQCSTKSHST